MTIDRVTVSLDKDTTEALNDLTDEAGRGQSGLFRRALTFYAANYQAARTDAGTKLGDYHEMLSGGEHVLLAVDFRHCFLEYVADGGDGVEETTTEEGYGGIWMLHTSLLSQNFLSNAGADVLEGMYGVRTKPPAGDATGAFESDYADAYPDADLFSPYSWNSYDALFSYALAVHDAGTTDSNAVKQRVRAVSNPDGETASYGAFDDGVRTTDFHMDTWHRLRSRRTDQRGELHGIN